MWISFDYKALSPTNLMGAERTDMNFEVCI